MFAAALFVMNWVAPIAVVKSEPVVQSGPKGNVIVVINGNWYQGKTPPPPKPGEWTVGSPFYRMDAKGKLRAGDTGTIFVSIEPKQIVKDLFGNRDSAVIGINVSDSDTSLATLAAVVEQFSEAVDPKKTLTLSFSIPKK